MSDTIPYSAKWIIQQSGKELGLPVGDAPVSSLAETDVQMLGLLNSAGYDLTSNYSWEELNRTYLFETVADKADYPFPDDYNYFQDSSGWDRTNRWPLLGPVSVQEWEALIAAKVTAVSRTYYKFQNKRVFVWPIPTVGGTEAGTQIAGRLLAIAYASLNWVEDSAAKGTYKPLITNDNDMPLLNPWLLVKLLKCKMWAAKGFDTTKLDNEYMTMFLSLSAKSKGSRVLSLAPKQGSVFIGVQNVPEGNWVR